MGVLDIKCDSFFSVTLTVILHCNKYLVFYTQRCVEKHMLVFIECAHWFYLLTFKVYQLRDAPTV
jgi:hypothetical protein